MPDTAGGPHGPRRLRWRETIRLAEYELFYPVILWVSKPIHLEASPLLYAGFCFELEDHFNLNDPQFIRFSTCLRRFLRRIGPQNLNLIRHMIIPFPAPSVEEPYRWLIMGKPSASLKLEPLSEDRVRALEIIQNKYAALKHLRWHLVPLSPGSPLMVWMMIKRMVRVKKNGKETMKEIRTWNKRDHQEEESKELNLEENSDEEDDSGDLDASDDFDDLNSYDEDEIVVDEENADFEPLTLMNARSEKIPTLKTIIIMWYRTPMSRRDDLEDRMDGYSMLKGKTGDCS